LALDKNRTLDEKHQVALTRYYIDAGAGAIAVGVHTTQFQIRDPKIGLFEPVLGLCSETVDDHCRRTGRQGVFKIAGICGKVEQALAEVEFALEAGYHAGLVSLGAYAGTDVEIKELLAHCRAVAEIIPIFGFYLQPPAGGLPLPLEFWRGFAEIDNVLAIKIAPFNRYQTLDVVRAVCEAGRQKEISLYTGNDDNIVIDLLTKYRFNTPRGEASVRIVGGLLGQWAVWTQKAVELLDKIHQLTAKDLPAEPELLTLGAQITDANAAIFDAANSFAGCIPGMNTVLYAQGLMGGTCCLDPDETLSPGQEEQIRRVHTDYPHLNDDAFVQENLGGWLAD